MSFDRIDHIGIAVRSLEQSVPLYRDILGLTYAGEDEVEEQGVRVAFFELGEAMLELLEPTREDSPIAKFLERNGEGVHHVAMACDDIEAERARVAGHGVRLLSDAPRDGAHGKLITFMHPKDTGRVLLEMTQRKHDAEH